LSVDPDRRSVLRAGAGLAAVLAARRAPAAVPPDVARPRIDEGVASGDPRPGGAIVWSRADRPARMWVDWATEPGFVRATTVRGPDTLHDTDFTAKLALTDLPADREIFYRVRFESLERLGVMSRPYVGRLRTPATQGLRPVTFAWSGDTAGQGYGINPVFGGMRIYDTIRRARPDLFIHCGDLIYADAPIRPQRHIDDGRVWTNLTTPAKSKVAETLEEFRGNFRYNLLDANVRALQAEVPTVVQWDDHETKNNWWPGRILHEDARYTVKSCSLLAARARRAFFEYTPITTSAAAPSRIYRALPQGPLLDVFMLDARAHRGPNSRNLQRSPGPETRFFGPRQIDWLLDRLTRSRATWKLVSSDQPIGLMIGHEGNHFEGIANGDGPPLGRELEIARLLAELKRRKVRNVVWVTADVHYAAAHHYSPKRARFQDFDPFWEFVAGPLNAATFGPNTLDDTFGPEEVFVSLSRRLPRGLPPLDGLQFYGLGRIDPRSKRLTVSLHDLEGTKLYSVDLEAR